MTRKQSKKKAPAPQKTSGDCTSNEKIIAKTQLHDVYETYEIDDVDIQLLSELRSRKPISLLKGKYRVSRRTLYNRARKLVSKGYLTYTQDGKEKHYFPTKEGEKIVVICFRGSESDAASASNFSSSGAPVSIFERNHNLVYELEIRTMPKSLYSNLSKGNWVTGVMSQNMTNWTRYYGDYQFERFIAHVVFTTKKVIVRLRDIWTQSIPEAADLGGEYILRIKKELEETFSFPGQRAFRLGDYRRRSVAAIRGSHHALVHHPLAQKCKDIGYSITGSRWSIDASQGRPESEATDPGFSADDADFEHQDLEWRTKNQNGVRENRKEIDAIKNEIKDIFEILKANSEVQRQILAQVISNTQSNAHLNQLVTQQNQQILAVISIIEKLAGGRN